MAETQDMLPDTVFYHFLYIFTLIYSIIMNDLGICVRNHPFHYVIFYLL
jgi:hypothetical protein